MNSCEGFLVSLLGCDGRTPPALVMGTEEGGDAAE